VKILDSQGNRRFPPVTPELLEPIPPEAEASRQLCYNVITISRTYGSRGGIVGQLAAERLGFTFYDKELLDHMVADTKAEMHHLARWDERRLDAFRATVLELLGTRYTQTLYVRSLFRVLRRIGKQGKAVILGRGANFALPHSFKVMVTAPLGLRVERIAREEGLSERDALRKITQQDRQREHFVQRTFGRNPRVPENYNMIVNTAEVSYEDAAGLIVCGLRCVRPEHAEALSGRESTGPSR
jgi:hypothetical protein